MSRAAATRPAPPPTRPAPTATAKAPPKFGIVRGVQRTSWKLGIYGPEGVGKSTLEASCPGIIIADLEHSTRDLDCARVDGILPDAGSATDQLAIQAQAWVNLRAWVQSVQSGCIGIDSMTRAEDWCAAWVIKHKKSNEGAAASDSIEDFKYRAGLQFVCDEYRRFLGDIELAYLRGVNVVMVAHNRIDRVKNPDGSDFVRYVPRLIDDPKASNMLQWVQFLDHLAFLDFDKDISKGKASGGGTRTLYLDGAPSRISKTRSLPPDPIPLELNSQALWELLNVKTA